MDSTILAWLLGLDHWAWFAVAGILLIGELVVPGSVLIWFGLAAGMVGAIALFVDLPWQVEVSLFAGFSVAALIAWRLLAARRAGENEALPFLNRRADRHVGRSFILTEPIVNGSGRLRIDDSVWRVSGPDAPAGTKVEVMGADGPLLLVAPHPAPEA